MTLECYVIGNVAHRFPRAYGKSMNRLMAVCGALRPAGRMLYTLGEIEERNALAPAESQYCFCCRCWKK